MVEPGIEGLFKVERIFTSCLYKISLWNDLDRPLYSPETIDYQWDFMWLESV